MAETILYVQEHGYATKEELRDAFSAASLSAEKHKKILEAARSELAHFQDLSSDERADLLLRIDKANQLYLTYSTLEKNILLVCNNIEIILSNSQNRLYNSIEL